MASIRLYEQDDYVAVGRVCLQTGRSGGDGTGLYSDDELLPLLFAYPYLMYAPDLAWVIDDGSVAGYIIGVADNADFAQWWHKCWIAEFTNRYVPGRNVMAESISPAEQSLVDSAYHPARMIEPALAAYPARLHINLLPRVQGSGYGRKLVETLVSELRNRGVTGLALGVSRQNFSAQKFYEKLSLTEMPAASNASTMKMVLDF